MKVTEDMVRNICPYLTDGYIHTILAKVACPHQWNDKECDTPFEKEKLPF